MSKIEAAMTNGEVQARLNAEVAEMNWLLQVMRKRCIELRSESAATEFQLHERIKELESTEARLNAQLKMAKKK